MRIAVFLLVMLVSVSSFGCEGSSQNQTAQNKNQPNVAVKSDPLKLRLNKEDVGTTADTSVLSKKLGEIFTQREATGVFRKGTNEVEKTVNFAADRSVSAAEIARLAGVLNSFDASPILIPVEIKRPDFLPKPNPLTLFVYAGADNPRPFNSGIEIGFIGELTDNNSGFPESKAAVAVVVDKSGAYSLDGKPISAVDLETELEKRLKAKEKGQKIIFVNAENYGNMEDVASIAASAGVNKVFFVTKNIAQTEKGLTFSLSPAFIKDKDKTEMSEISTIDFKLADSATFEITMSTDLLSKDKADAEIKSFEEDKKNLTDTESSRTEIDGSSGILTFNSADSYSSANWAGFRKKDGKYQLVMIKLMCHGEPSLEQCSYTRNELSQIIKSIKFN